MKPENPDEALLERGLAAWDVPEPPHDLADRILAQNAEALTALGTPPTPAPTPREPSELEEERPAMLPTTIRNESSMRPFWTATALGFAAAAAIVLAFMAGRESQAPTPMAPIAPNVEIQVTAPAPVTQPPTPPTPPTPPAPPEVPKEGTTKLIYVSEDSADPPPTPPKVRGVRGGRTSPDLKNPFDSDKGPSRSTPDVERPAKDPFGSDKSFKDPFARGEATLRLGTVSGSAPAEVTVDGKPVGKTPIASHKVSPGKHTVVFRWPSKRRSFEIEVEANEVRVVRGDDK